MFGFGSRNTTVYGALYDISSDSVGVALLESDHTEALPKLIFAHRVRIRLPAESEDLHVRMRFMREALVMALRHCGHTRSEPRSQKYLFHALHRGRMY
jgi:hypothetical protein